MGTFNKCCCCNLGSVIPRWQNVTKVRPAGDTLGPNYTSAPFPRLDGSTNTGCSTDPVGTCGPWLFAGDENGVVAQSINAGVNDVGTCGETQVDHNCYYNDGSTTVDMRLTKLFGAQWVLAQKQWHGIFGFTSNDALPSPDPNVAADQTKYRTMSATATQWLIGSGDPTLTQYGYEYSGSCTVGQYTGIQTTSCTYTNIGHPSDPTNITAALQTSAMYGPTPNISALTNGQWNGVNAVDPEVNTGWTGSWTQSATEFYFEADFYNYESEDGDAAIIVMEHYEVTVTLSDPYTAAECYADFTAALAAWDMSNMNLAHLRQDERLADAPLIVYDEVGPTQPSLPTQTALWGFFVLRASGTMDDLNSPITDANGNAPFTSVNSSPPPGWTYSPGNNGVAIDYVDGEGNNYYVLWPGWEPTYDPAPVDWVPTYAQIPWLDPNNYVWEYPDGAYVEPDDWSGGATLITPLRTGAIVAHTQAGSDPHFWFNFEKLVRQYNEYTDNYEWVIQEHGGFSDGTIPPVAMRWQTGLAAQYDAGTPVVNPPPGNYPQMFWNQYGGQITGGKYVQATQSWPAVNYGRPCGPDKYAVDQTTVCCVTGGDSTDGYTVVATEFANHPLGAGGLAVGNYIMVGGDGLYQISSITDDGAVSDGDGGTVEQYTIMVGAILDTIPTGVDIGGGYLGLLRFPAASGICGRAAISTSYDSGTVTITPTSALPYLREGVTGGISVDIYDGSMTLLASGVALMRVNDSEFTVVHAAMPTAAYMTGAGVNWTQYNSTSQRTGVHLEWTFNARGAQSGVTSPPAWYGDIPGVLTCSIAQFNYDAGTCPAVMGIVPFTDGSSTVEGFANQTMFDFPSTVVFDDVFGNHGQAAVMLTMPDPFWQTPFVPSCTASQTFEWTEDDGTSETDTETVKFYPHHPLVEAASTIPSGESLPSGLTLTYDPSNIIAPPYYPTGFSVVNADGSFGSYATDWGFALNVCANLGGRFAGDYTFVSC